VALDRVVQDEAGEPKGQGGGHGGGERGDRDTLPEPKQGAGDHGHQGCNRQEQRGDCVDGEITADHQPGVLGVPGVEGLAAGMEGVQRQVPVQVQGEDGQDQGGEGDQQGEPFHGAITLDAWFR